MLKIEEFEEILKENNFKETTINLILSKNLATLLKKTHREEMDKVIKVLMKHNIDEETIANSLSVLVIGKVNGKADEIEKKFEIFRKYNIKEETIKNSLLVLAQGEVDEIEKVIETFEKNNIKTEIVEKCLSVVSRTKSSEIIKILKVLDKYEISTDAIEKCLTVISKGKADEIEKILDLLIVKNNIDKKTIENCLSILAQGKADEIERILEVLNKYRIKNSIINECPSVLALGKAKEIEDIIRVFTKYDVSISKFNNCPSLLLFNKADEIENIFKVLIENELKDDVINRCLYVFRGNSIEISKILELFKENGIQKETLVKGLSILASGKYENIKESFEIYNKNGINSESLNKMYRIELFKEPKFVRNIFDSNPKNLKDYVKFKGKYNKVLSLEEIEEICEYKKIDKETFIKKLISKSTWEYVLETLESKKSIYVGKSIPMTEQYMKDNQENLVKWADYFARCYSLRHGLKGILEELKSNITGILITKCGDIAYNIETNPEKLTKCLYTKCEKYLEIYRIVKRKEIPMFFQEEKKIGFFVEKNKKKGIIQSKSKAKNIDLNEWNANDDERNILFHISEKLEEGYDFLEAIEIISDECNIKTEEILKKIEKIKQKNIGLAEKNNKKIDGDERG